MNHNVNFFGSNPLTHFHPSHLAFPLSELIFKIVLDNVEQLTSYLGCLFCHIRSHTGMGVPQMVRFHNSSLYTDVTQLEHQLSVDVVDPEPTEYPTREDIITSLMKESCPTL